MSSESTGGRFNCWRSIGQNSICLDDFLPVATFYHFLRRTYFSDIFICISSICHLNLSRRLLASRGFFSIPMHHFFPPTSSSDAFTGRKNISWHKLERSCLWKLGFLKVYYFWSFFPQEVGVILSINSVIQLSNQTYLIQITNCIYFLMFLGSARLNGSKNHICFLVVLFMGCLYRVWNDILFFWTIYFQFGTAWCGGQCGGGWVSVSSPLPIPLPQTILLAI